MNNKILALVLLGFMVFPGFAGELPGWLKNWKVKGDLRLRVEGKDSDADNIKNRNRARYRLRIAADNKITDQLSVNLRLASGTGDPTSTNQTFDNSFSGKDLWIDRAQLTYKTGGWTIAGGKMKNPFHSTDIVWDSDVNPEGFFQTYSSGGFYTTLGEMFVEEESSGEDVNLYALQMGFKGGDEHKWNVSGTYYNYDNGLQSQNGSDAYKFLDATATFDTSLGSLPIKVQLDYVENTSSSVDDDNNALGAFVTFGAGANPGDFTFQLKYAEIEELSVAGGFADSDFGHSDVEGFAAKLGYKQSKHISWKASFWSVDSINHIDEGFNYLQLDCSAKF
jgi:hypothetical protein